MIEITRNDKSVKLTFDTGVGWNIDFSFNAGDDLYATLLKNQLNKTLSQKIQAIKKESYEEGWKDKASKKKQKKDWFNGSIKHNT